MRSRLATWPPWSSEYVRAAHEDGIAVVRIVHGRGRGVQRGIVQAALEAHPLVEAFWDDTDAHLGATFARLSAGCTRRPAARRAEVTPCAQPVDERGRQTQRSPDVLRPPPGARRPRARW